MGFETSYKPATLTLFHLNCKFKPGTGRKLCSGTNQLIQTSLDRRQSGHSLIRALHPAVIHLTSQVGPKLAPELGWGFHQHL